MDFRKTVAPRSRPTLAGSHNSESHLDLPLVEDGRDHAPDDQKKEDGQKNEAVSRDSLLVAQGPQSLDAARREVTDEFRIRGGRTAHGIIDSTEGAHQIVLSHAEIVVMIGSGFDLG